VHRDELWVSTGHAIHKERKDKTVKTGRPDFLAGISTKFTYRMQATVHSAHWKGKGICVCTHACAKRTSLMPRIKQVVTAVQSVLLSTLLTAHLKW